MNPPQTFVSGASNSERRMPFALPLAPAQTKVVASFMLFLALGMMVGAAIGWIIFPIELEGLLPVSQNTPQTRQYITAVADKYWHNLDAVEAQKALSAYDPVELVGIMAVVLDESKSTETRAHVAALAQALDLIPPDTPFAAVLAQPLLVMTFLASLIPLAIGIWLVLLPAWRERKLEQEREAEELAMGIAPARTRRGGAGGRSSQVEEGQDSPEGIGDDVLPGVPEDDEITPDTVIGAPNPEGGDGTSLPPLQPNAPAADTEEEAEEHAAEEKSILKDLANLFEEEDVSLSALEALTKKLPEVAVDELLARARDIAQQIKTRFRARPSARS